MLLHLSCNLCLLHSLLLKLELNFLINILLHHFSKVLHLFLNNALRHLISQFLSHLFGFTFSILLNHLLMSFCFFGLSFKLRVEIFGIEIEPTIELRNFFLCFRNLCLL